jgi:dimethylargininase
VTVTRKLVASVVTALAIAAIAQVGTIIIWIIANTLNANVIPVINGIYITASLFLFIALAVFGFLGAFSRWFVALPAGLVFGIASALGGWTIYEGSKQVSSTVAELLLTLVSTNLPFILVATLASVFVGVPLYRRVLFPTESTDAAGTRRIALVRVPADNLAAGQVTHISRTLVDTDLANEQWDNYVTALLENGWSTVEVQPAPTLADSVFVEDVVVVFGSTAVITNPGSDERKPETAAVEKTLADLDLEVARIVEPGTLDGGDVLKVGDTVYVGRGGRTNGEGIRQLRAILAPTDYVVVAVPVTKVLHLKSAVTALPDGTVIGHPSTVDDAAIFGRYLEMPEAEGAHVVVLAPDTVLMAASAPKSAALLEDLGYRVVVVDISEFEKLEGCVTCLSVRIR